MSGPPQDCGPPRFNQLIALADLPELVRRRLLRLDRQLVEVKVLPAGAPIPPWVPTRLNTRLHALLRLVDLVLAHQAVEHLVGNISVRGFVLSVSRLSSS
jgi:5-methylcytosine-specific restriction enzyme subunit McrC